MGHPVQCSINSFQLELVRLTWVPEQYAAGAHAAGENGRVSVGVDDLGKDEGRRVIY